MELSDAAGLPHVDRSLDTIRAAILIVAEGAASRVTIHTPAALEVMPAARQLARASGVSVQLVESADSGSDLVVLPVAQQGA